MTTCLSAALRARKQLGAETNAREKSRQMWSDSAETTTNAGKIHGKCFPNPQKRPQTPEKYTANVVNFGRNDNKRQRKNTANVSKIRKNDNKHRKSETTHALVSRAGITRRQGMRKYRSKAPMPPRPAAQSRKQPKSTNRAHAHDSRERANAHQLPQNRALP